MFNLHSIGLLLQLDLVKLNNAPKLKYITLKINKSKIEDFMKEKYKGIPTPKKES